jgi:hypothetical protein
MNLTDDKKADKRGFYVLNLNLLKMSLKSAEGRLKGIICFDLNLLKNEPHIGRRPIKGDFMFLI